MVKFLARRLIAVAAVVLMVTVVTWISIHGLRPEAFQFDQRPTLEQLGDYLVQAFLHLEFGNSFQRPNPPVSGMLRQGLPADVVLLVGGMAFGLLFGLAAGTFVGAQPRRAVSRAIEAVSMFFLCAPVYVVGLSALLVFGSGIAVSGIGFIPVKYVPFEESPLRWLSSMIVPWIVVGLPLAAVCERMMNSSMREVLHEEFVRTALSKGISHRRMLRRHAVPAAAAPVLTVAGVSVPVMVTNMVLVELTFSIPGVFQTFRSSMDNEDYPVIMGIVIAAAVLVALGSLLVDLALAWLDPKLRAGNA
jgi:peptide/nickel transport system permease protein